MAINMTKAFYTHKCNETVPTSPWNSHFLGWKQFELNNHFNQPGTLEGIDFAHLFAWWPPICAHVTHDSVCSSSMCARVPISILPHYPCPWSRNVTRALWAGKLWWPLALAWWPVVTRAMARVMVTLVTSVLTTPTHHWLPNGACPHSADELGHALITIYSSPECPSAEEPGQGTLISVPSHTHPSPAPSQDLKPPPDC